MKSISHPNDYNSYQSDMKRTVDGGDLRLIKRVAAGANKACLGEFLVMM
jgi:hypothetical protein